MDKDFGGGFCFRVPLYVAVALGEGVIFLSADWNPPRSLKTETGKTEVMVCLN